MTLAHCKRTCPECPWRKDVEVGRFPPERFVALAYTAEDMAQKVFACHKSPEDGHFACAGATLRMQHNLRLRLARIDRSTIRADGPLYKDYREMAVANGVPEDHPALAKTR
jgi:hypothetical protein